MLVNIEKYILNPRTGEPLSRELVTIICDKCEKSWQAKYKHYKSFKKESHRDLDLCIGCRNALGINGVKGIKKRLKGTSWINLICTNCKKDFKRSVIGNPRKRVFCSNECSSKYRLEEKFGFLLKNIDYLQDELAYLTGSILGDGTITTENKNYFTRRICIYCDAKKLNLISQLKEILCKLHIPFYDSKNRESCVVVGFSLPVEILKILGINYIGDKFKNQPTATENIVNNINFAVGLLNSDGYLNFRQKSKCKVVSFNNTVESIIRSFVQCMTKNGIFVAVRKADKSQLGWKDSYTVWIERQQEISRLENMIKFKLKDYCLTK